MLMRGGGGCSDLHATTKSFENAAMNWGVTWNETWQIDRQALECLLECGFLLCAKPRAVRPSQNPHERWVPQPPPPPFPPFFRGAEFLF